MAEDEKKEEDITNQLSQTQMENEIINNNSQHDIIVKVDQETSLGNLVPGIISLEQHYIDPSSCLDQSGYNILHHAISFNKLSGIVPLIEKFNFDVNSLSSIKQTPLMIAAHFGNLKIAKYLLDKGADINSIDDNQFNAILYSVKSNHPIMFFYLLSKGADIQKKDSNGCSIVHWTAFNNNLTLLHFFKTIGLDLNQKDYYNYTPFQRALFNESYDVVKFYLSTNIFPLYPDDWDIYQLRSPSMIRMLNQYNKKRKGNKIEQFKEYLNTRQGLLFYMSVYIISICYLFLCYLKGVIWRLNYEGIDHNLNILLFIILICIMPLYYYFIGKVENAQPDKLDSSSFINANSREEFKTIYNLVQHQEDDPQIRAIKEIELQQYNQKNSVQRQTVKKNFIHQVVELIEENKFHELNKVREESLCMHCIQYKKSRYFHCSICGHCIFLFNHHSYFFNKCISRFNHKPYYILLTLQQIGLFLFVLLHIIAFQNKLTSYKILALFEIPYIMHQESYTQWYQILGFYYGIILLFQNSLDFIIETYGILLNLTRYEIFNRQKCQYFFDNIHLDNLGKAKRFYRNPYNKGLIKNIVDYVICNSYIRSRDQICNQI